MAGVRGVAAEHGQPSDLAVQPDRAKSPADTPSVQLFLSLIVRSGPVPGTPFPLAWLAAQASNPQAFAPRNSPFPSPLRAIPAPRRAIPGGELVGRSCTAPAEESWNWSGGVTLVLGRSSATPMGESSDWLGGVDLLLRRSLWTGREELGLWFGGIGGCAWPSHVFEAKDAASGGSGMVDACGSRLHTLGGGQI